MSTDHADPASDDASDDDRALPRHAINIRNLSVKCGACGVYQTLVAYRPGEDGWNVYTYECEGTACDPAATRTLLEVPVPLDAFARRDPTWHGGRIHAGSGDHD